MLHSNIVLKKPPYIFLISNNALFKKILRNTKKAVHTGSVLRTNQKDKNYDA